MIDGRLTQHERIIDYLKLNGSVTEADGFTEFTPGITKINSRCLELIALHYPILKREERSESGARYTRYYWSENCQAKLF